jgi:CubicO group peptidase (beta-lactamase class C family)
MTIRRFVALALLALGVASSPFVATPAAAQTVPPGLAAGVADVLQPFVDRHTLAGAVALVADRDKVLTLESVGWADIDSRKPMRGDCLFWIASQSKPITAAGLMLLVDEGRVCVDAPVEKYLPEFRGQLLAVTRGKDKVLRKPSRPITVKDVLTHTSGLPFRSPLEQPTLDLFPLAERVQSYAKLPLEFEPGSRYQYSNAGINTAGRIIEVVGGMPYAEFMDRRLFRPLGMKDTTFWPRGEQLTRLAKAYRPNAAKTGLEETPIGQLKYPLDDPQRQPMPAGGLFSTANDLARFYRMIINGGQFEGRRCLSTQAVRQMTSKQTGDLPTAYGFGFNTGGGRIGHGGAYNTNTSIHEEHGLITVFLVQHAGWTEEGKQILPAFQRAAVERFAKPASVPAAARPRESRNVIVFKQPGRYGGWPANAGIWAWGNEIVVGFTAAWYKAAKKDHAVDRTKPFEKWQARSLDGGLTWSIEKPPCFVGAPALPKAVPLDRPLEFNGPNFAMAFDMVNMHVGPSRFFASMDRCRTWQGPYSLAIEGIDKVAARTDYVVLGPRECLMFASAAKQDTREGRPFCARTTDGGLHWRLASTIGPEPEGYAIMPSSVRLPGGSLLTTIRHWEPKRPASIDAYTSDDGGSHWKSLGAAAPNIGGGNPPSLVLLGDGRLCLTYGYRARPWGVRARTSSDRGRTWGPEIVLRDDALTGDLGYPRSVQRPDGQVVTVYYFNGPRDEDRAIEATVWRP